MQTRRGWNHIKGPVHIFEAKENSLDKSSKFLGPCNHTCFLGHWTMIISNCTADKRNIPESWNVLHFRWEQSTEVVQPVILHHRGLCFCCFFNKTEFWLGHILETYLGQSLRTATQCPAFNSSPFHLNHLFEAYRIPSELATDRIMILSTKPLTQCALHQAWKIYKRLLPILLKSLTEIFWNQWALHCVSMWPTVCTTWHLFRQGR